MNSPVNLNKVRKDRARAEKKARADRNAVTFGQSKADKQANAAKTDKARRDLDGHKRET